MNLEDLERQYNLPSGLLNAVMQTESGGNPNAVSPKGAVGAFQFMPATAQQYGIDPSNPDQAAEGAARMYRDLLSKYGGDFPKALAGYNWGQGNVDRKGLQNAPPETQGYIQKVSGRMDINKVIDSLPDVNQSSQGTSYNAAIDSLPDVKQPNVARQLVGGLPFFGENTPDVAAGAMQVLHGAAQLGAKALPDSAQQGLENVSKWAGDKYQSIFQPDQTPGADIGQAMGQAIVTAPMVPARLAALATTLPRAAGLGAATGAVTNATLPVADDGSFWQQKGDQLKSGALAGGIAGGAMGAAGRMLNPQTSDGVRMLMKEGVTPTPGQAAGGWVKTLEEKMTSIPLLGDAIKSGQSRGLNEFNRAIYNRILAPIGQKYEGPAGQDAIATVGGKLSDAYDAVLSKIPRVDVDQTFGAQTLQLKSMAKSLPPEQATQFDNILQNEVWNKLTPAGTLSGDSMKAVEGNLGRISRGYKGSPDPDQRTLGAAVNQIQANLRSLVARQYPDQAPVLQGVNQGWAQLTQLENAANTTKVARNAGVVTPADYLRGIKKSDNSVRDRQFAQGNAMNQDLAQAGDAVLSSKYPDSGSIGRAIIGLGAAGAAHFVHPGIPIAGGIGALAYTPWGQKALAGLLASRPEWMQAIGDQAKRAAPYLGLGAPGLLGAP